MQRKPGSPDLFIKMHQIEKALAAMYSIGAHKVDILSIH